MNFYININFAL